MNNKSKKNRKSKKIYKHNHNKTKKINCSPSNNDKPYTCYSDKSLIKLRDLWNSRHPDNKIHTSEPREIWKNLKINLNNSCDNEKCWLRQNFAKNNLDSELMYYTFAPQTPKEWKTNPNEWLSSRDITMVMKQYEKKYPCFSFIGPSPIDFDTRMMYGQCVWDELCSFDLQQYINKGKNKIGIIFNLDPHYKSGSHWVAMFIHITKKPYIYYFDSNGITYPKEIKTLIDRIKKQGSQIGINFDLHVNEIEHQKSDTECGMYTLYVIIQLLTEQKTYEYFNTKIVRDNIVEQFRYIYFNHD